MIYPEESPYWGGNQLKYRVAGNTATVTAGTVGFVPGQAMIQIPVVGGVIGSFVAGTTAGYIVKDATDLA